MVGILTEKPSAARNFAKALGGGQGNYNGEQFVIVNARGHLYEFVSPEKQVDANLSDKYHSWNVENLPWNKSDFKWKREAKKDTSDVINNIKNTLSKCDEIAIATDVDPTGEGNLLAWEILDELDFHRKKISRMEFIDESPASIQKAFKTRKPLKSMLSDMDFVKAFYRSKWDFLSMQFTRIATKYGDGKSVLRQGRLKSTMVLLTGQGLDAVKAYKKIPYYQNRFRDENGVVYTNLDEPSFPDKSQVPQSYTPSAVVVDSKENKSSSPPKMLDLAALSSRLSGKGVKAKAVLDVYQKMYEAQIVSYPRTEDKTITTEQFNELLPLIDKIAAVVGVDTSILTHRAPRKTHVKDGGAHGANRPGVNVPASLDSLTQYGSCAPMIYEILALNYLATLAEDYEYEQQKGHLQKYPDFKGTANVPKKQGWKAVFSDDSDDEDTEDTSKGLGTEAKPYIHEGFPPKPPAPTMKWLMKQLEKHDVGTGATRTSTYAEVTSEKAKYPLMVEKKGKLALTQFGDMSYLLLKDTNIGNVATTERLMQEMRDIAAGKLNPDDCLDGIRQMVLDDMEIMKRNSVTMRKTLGVTEQKTQKEKYIGVWSVTGEEVTFNREWNGYRFSDAELKELLAGREITIMGLKSSDGREYGAKGKLEEFDYKGKTYVGFNKSEFITNGPKAEYCEGMWKGKRVKFKRVWSGHRFTDEECRALLAGEKIEITGLKNADGKEYGVAGMLADQDFKGKKFFGFKNLGFLDNDNAPDRCKGEWNGKEISFKKEFRGHVFTDAECEALLAGKEITIEGLKSSKGSTYGVYGKLAEQKYNGRKYVGFEQLGFAGSKSKSGSKIPDEWCHHKFTDDEKTLLERGETIFVEGCVSKKGSVFSCKVKFGKNDKGYDGIVIVKN